MGFGEVPEHPDVDDDTESDSDPDPAPRCRRKPALTTKQLERVLASLLAPKKKRV